MKILKESDKSAIKIAIDILNNDGIICFATETVYAIACNAASDQAVLNLYKIKERDKNKPIAIFAPSLENAKNFLVFNELEEKIAKKFMPGMITLILKKKPTKDCSIKISKFLNQEAEDLGLRIPNHKFCLELLSRFDGIIAATSANISNQDAATDCDMVKKYFAEKVDLLIDGGVCVHKIASTVLKVVDKNIKIIRKGLIDENSIYAKINQ